MEFCRYEKKDHVAYVTITRPNVMNALHPAASRELAGAWDDFAADDDMWVGVLTGEGDKAFSAGNDLKNTAEMSRLPREERPDQSMPASGFGGLTSRFDLYKPIVARINGFALGGGLEMALACDIMIAADHAEVGLPEPRRGLIAGALGVHRLPNQIPLKAAMGYMLTGRHIPAQRAYELGLVSQVVPLAELDAAVAGCVNDIIRCAPLSVRATKQAVMEGRHLSIPEAATTRFEWETRRRASADAIEGPRAFAEKRAPNWQGK